MSILSNFEDHVSKLFEGVAGSLFRSPVEPVQIAKVAEKEMGKNKLVSLGKTYAPTLYTVLLSETDDKNLSGFYPTLSGEFATYLMGKANESSLYFAAPPLVRFMIDDGLSTGKFEVIAESVSEDELSELREEEEELWEQSAPAPVGVHAPYYPPSPSSRPSAASPSDSFAPRESTPEAGRIIVPTADMHAKPARESVLIDLKSGKSYALTGNRVVIGRDATSSIPVSDINVSRAHAELTPEGSGWTVTDLHSTNGTYVNDQPVSFMRLVPGDSVTVGVTRFEYQEG